MKKRPTKKQRSKKGQTVGDVLKELKKIETLVRQFKQQQQLAASSPPTVSQVNEGLANLEERIEEVRQLLQGIDDDEEVTPEVVQQLTLCNVGNACGF